MTSADPKIAIRNVSFDYVNEKKAYHALQNVNLEIREGCSSACWGPPAAGNPRCSAC